LSFKTGMFGVTSRLCSVLKKSNVRDVRPPIGGETRDAPFTVASILYATTQDALARLAGYATFHMPAYSRMSPLSFRTLRMS